MTSTTELRTACDCGSTAFYVEESLTHKADVEDGKLIVTKADWTNEVARIVCQDCDTEFDMDAFDATELF